MTPRLALSVFYDPNVFQAEIFASFLLVFFVLLSKYFIDVIWKLKFIIVTPLFFTFAYFLSITTTWVLLRFITQSANATIFVTPINVIVQSFFQGITKNLNGTPLINGVWYIIGAQFIGSLAGLKTFFVTTWFTNKYYISKKNYFWFKKDSASTISVLSKNNLQVQSYFLTTQTRLVNDHYWWQTKTSASFQEFIQSIISTFSVRRVSLWKFGIKEMFFILFLVTTAPFYHYISQPNYGTTVFLNFLILVFSIFILLVLSETFGYFMFNFNLSIVLNLLLWFFQIKKWLIVVEVVFSGTWTIIWSMVVTAIFLKIANNSDLQFSL